MTKTPPHYLRVHRGAEQPSPPSTPVDQDVLHDFWSNFSTATGWRIDRRSERGSWPATQVIPAVNEITIDPVDPELAVMVSRAAATRLALSATRLADELRSNREALRYQELELASRAAILTGRAAQSVLSARLDSVLETAATACRCDAAVLYLLDDETEHLKARASFGTAPGVLEKAPRTLRGSRGDLEAMVQDVVKIDDLQAGPIDTWNCPEPYAAGICAAVRSDDIPIGTLWFFRNSVTEFGLTEPAAAQLAAGAVAAELARVKSDSSESWGLESSVRTENRTLSEVAQWQHQSLPLGARLAEHWLVDGMVESPHDWATGWHMWDILPDGSLVLAIAEAVDRSVMGALNAAMARSAFTSHSGYRHTPLQLLQRVSDTLWHTSSGEQLVSLLYARVDPETGQGEIASAGSIQAMIANRYGYRPLISGDIDPLGMHVNADGVQDTFRMMPGETLFANTPGLLLDGATQAILGNRIRAAMQAGDANPLAAIRRELAAMRMDHERGAATLLRL